MKHATPQPGRWLLSVGVAVSQLRLVTGHHTNRVDAAVLVRRREIVLGHRIRCERQVRVGYTERMHMLCRGVLFRHDPGDVLHHCRFYEWVLGVGESNTLASSTIA